MIRHKLNKLMKSIRCSDVKRFFCIDTDSLSGPIYKRYRCGFNSTREIHLQKCVLIRTEMGLGGFVSFFYGSQLATDFCPFKGERNQLMIWGFAEFRTNKNMKI